MEDVCILSDSTDTVFANSRVLHIIALGKTLHGPIQAATVTGPTSRPFSHGGARLSQMEGFSRSV